MEVAFHCKINNSIDPYWVVNNQATHSTYQKDRLTAQGFIFEEGEEGGVAMLTLKVNTTDDKNQTQLFCFSLPGTRSLTATLLTITGKHRLAILIMLGLGKLQLLRPIVTYQV